MRNNRFFVYVMLITVFLISLFAIGCKKESYVIEYETNGGFVKVDSREVEYGKSFVLDVPQMDNATFLGWFDSPDDGAKAVTDRYGCSIENYAKQENSVVFAKWDYWETLNLEYNLSADNSHYSVSGGGDGYSRIKIPETYKGLPVVKINAYAFYDNSEIKEVVCSDSIVEIGDFAFAKCNNLERISLSNQLTDIGRNSFEECIKLTSVNIPTALETIGEKAFASCKSLSEMDFSSVEGELTVKEGAFQGCLVLSKVDFGKAIKVLNKYTFAACSSLTVLETGDYIEEIASYSFENSGVRTLKIGKNVKSIGASFTNGCADLSAIEVSLENDYFSAENNVLYNKDKTILLRYAPLLKDVHYTVLDSVTTIATSSFDNVYYLEKITVKTNVENIEKGAFSRLNALESMDLPFIGGSINFNNYFAYIFGAEISSEITNLPETLLYVSIADGITTIPAYAFQYCGNLKEINVPNTVKSIGDSAFYGCSNLIEINVPQSVQSIGEFAFYACMRLSAINVAVENENYMSDEGVLYNKDKTYLLQYPAAKTEKEYVVADTVSVLSKGAFYNAVKLEKVVLPQNLQKVDDYAFALCRNLESIVLPDCVEYIGVQAFANCRGIVEINIPKKTLFVGQQCFYNCKSLIKIVIECEQVPEIDSTILLNTNEELRIVFNIENTKKLFESHAIWSLFKNLFVIA